MNTLKLTDADAILVQYALLQLQAAATQQLEDLVKAVGYDRFADEQKRLTEQALACNRLIVTINGISEFRGAE